MLMSEKGTAVRIHQESTWPSRGACPVQAVRLFLTVGRTSLGHLCGPCSRECASRRAAVDSLPFDVSLLLRFKITFKKLPTSKVTEYFWMARGTIAKLWFPSDVAVWDSANRPDCTTSCQCQLLKLFAFRELTNASSPVIKPHSLSSQRVFLIGNTQGNKDFPDRLIYSSNHYCQASSPPSPHTTPKALTCPAEFSQSTYH